MKTFLLNADDSGTAESNRNSIRRATARILALAIGVAVTSCAQHEPPVARRLGPAMCKEGPPSWRASDGRQMIYRTWGPAHDEPRAIVVSVPGWNGTAGDIEPLGRYLAQRGIRVYSTGVRGQHGDLTAASQHTKGHTDDGFSGAIRRRPFFSTAKAWVRLPQFWSQGTEPVRAKSRRPGSFCIPRQSR